MNNGKTYLSYVIFYLKKIFKEKHFNIILLSCRVNNKSKIKFRENFLRTILKSNTNNSNNTNLVKVNKKKKFRKTVSHLRNKST